jgi:putative ABC transport system ATP-binding protein
MNQPVNRLPQIELIDVVKTFTSAAGEFTALKHVSAAIEQGEFVSIIGKSGSGKSTLVNMITGIDHPTSGRVMVGDICVTDMHESARALWRGKNLGVVFQFFQMLPILSLLENVMLPMDFCDMYDLAERETRALELLHLVGLEHEADCLPAAVSGGQLQCAAIARALANDPPVIVADEPTGNLDSKTAAQVMDLFEQMKQRGKTIVMVTHDRSLAQRATRTILISDGELIEADIAHTLPMLPYASMQSLARTWQTLEFAPGAALTLNGPLYVIESGEVVFRCGSGVVFTLKTGDCFSAYDLQALARRGGKLLASPDTPLRLRSLPPDSYNALITPLPPALERLQSLATERFSAAC